MATRCFKVLVSTLLLGCLSPSSALMGNSSLPDYRLLQDLLNGYDPTASPQSSTDEPIEVTVNYVLMSVNNVDETAQTITVNGWLSLTWTDAFLQWDPALYENIDMIVVPSKMIWLPDVAFSNSIDNLFLDFSNFAVSVYSDGSVSFLPGGPITLSCSLNITNFPFDVQICSIIVTSWTTPERAMKYLLGSFTKDLLIENGEWAIVDLNATYESYESAGETYSDVYLYMLLQRKPLYRLVNTILPVIMLSFLNLAVFLLPPDSGEKVSLSMTVLLAYALWLLMMSSITPSTSDHFPLIATFITLLMGISTLAVFVTVSIIHLHHTDASKPVPAWLQKLSTVDCGRWKRANKVQQLNSTRTISWRMVASAVDSIAFYVLLSITVLIMLSAIGIIGSKAASQPSSLTSLF